MKPADDEQRHIAMIRVLLRQNRELTKALELFLPPPPLAFIPNAFQQGILAALNGKALRTDALGAAVGSRSRLFHADALPELIEQGLVANHKRIGYYRPDAPPPGFVEAP